MKYFMQHEGRYEYAHKIVLGIYYVKKCFKISVMMPKFLPFSYRTIIIKFIETNDTRKNDMQ